MNLSLFLFLIGTLGFILNRKNIILMIISIEIMLLAVIKTANLNRKLITLLKKKFFCLACTSYARH